MLGLIAGSAFLSKLCFALYWFKYTRLINHRRVLPLKITNCQSDNLPKQRWGHADLNIQNTNPGMSVERAMQKLSKTKKVEK